MPPEIQPADIEAIIEAMPPKALLGFIKAEWELSRTVFQGFSARDNSLNKPVVRQRLERELAKRPDLAEKLLELWLATYADLMDDLNQPDFTPSAEALQPFLDVYGEKALRFGLSQAEREDVKDWADRLPQIHAATPPGPNTIVREAPKGPTEQELALQREVEQYRQEIADMRRDLREALQERDEARRDAAEAGRYLARHSEETAQLRKQLDAANQRLEREVRRVKKAEEEAERLRREAKRAAPPAPAKSAPVPAPLSANASEVIAEAIDLLQRGLQLSLPAPAEEKKIPATAVPQSPSAPAHPPRPHVARKDTGPSISLPTGKGKHPIPIARIVKAFTANDVAFVEQIRDGLAHLGASNPQKEREALATLKQAGIPEAVLVGALRPAIVDGSNIANMSPERRARLAYLQQIQQSAWGEGYFPVTIIVDASLRHQIDQADLLMELVERGEIRMADPGTSADELIIEEAARRRAVIITNDRMSNWPAAKDLEKRHAEINNGSARVGNFHRSSSWLPW